MRADIVRAVFTSAVAHYSHPACQLMAALSLSLSFNHGELPTSTLSLSGSARSTNCLYTSGEKTSVLLQK